MHSRTALALVCALGLMAAGALENHPGGSPGADIALAQVLPTATRFVPRPAPTLFLPTPIPTVGLPGGFPLVPSPTPSASPTLVPTGAARPPAADRASPGAPGGPSPTTAPAAPAATVVASPTAATADTAPAPLPAEAPPAPTEVAPAAAPLEVPEAPTSAADAARTPTPADAGAMPPAPPAAGPAPAPPPGPPPAAPGGLPPAEPEPPAIQLRFGTALYDGVRGSYCWNPTPAPGVGAAPGLCADVLPPAFDTVLAWPAGEPLEFVVNGPAPITLSLTVYSTPTDPLVLRTDLTPATSATWQPTVAPGAYVLGVAARWPQGDVIYYFPVGILPADAASGPSAVPSFEPGDGIVGAAGPEAPPPVAPAPSPSPPGTQAVRPAPSPLPAPSPAPPGAAAPAAPSAEGARVLLRDEFEDTNSGFPLESRDPTVRRLGYRNGEYMVVRLAGSGGEAFVAHPEMFGDFEAEIDARLVPPTDNAYLFLDFRRQENGDYYSFLVDPNAGRFLLLRHTGEDRRLIDWTAAPAIQAGTATNRLGVRARGSTIVLLLDGAEVGRAQDGALREGWVGFGVGSLADERAEARFSHLLVTAVE